MYLSAGRAVNVRTSNAEPSSVLSFSGRPRRFLGASSMLGFTCRIVTAGGIQGSGRSQEREGNAEKSAELA